MENVNFVLVRSPNLIDENQIGYGWKNIDFSKFETFEQLIKEGFKGVDRGRTTNQIKRYFNLKEGDYVIVPFSSSIAIAEVIGVKSYHPNENIKYSENRISVRYLKHENGFFIPRKNLSTALQSRLKIRMSVCNLNEFSDEINKYVESLKNNTLYTWTSEQSEKENKSIEKFKTDLLSRIRKNKEIYLKSGGIGLEYLIKEILQAKGYEVRIPAKNEKKGIQDADIIAIRNTEFCDKEGIFIQVKHHSGNTGIHGIKQIGAYEIKQGDYSYIQRVLITTAEFKNTEFANEQDVSVLAGMDFINWLYDNLNYLSEKSLLALGISNVPTLL